MSSRSKTSKTSDLKNLFQSALTDGNIDPQSLTALVNIPDLGEEIQKGLGVKPSEIQSAEAFMIALMPDDSSSIAEYHNEELIRQAHNTFIERTKKRKQHANVLVHTRYLNGFVLYPFVLIEDAKIMDATNYRGMGWTPLYDQSLILLASVVKASQDFYDEQTMARTMTLLISDGEDTSSKSRASDVAKFIAGLPPERHIVAALGVKNPRVDFQKIFQSMGIPEHWIRVASADPDEFLDAIDLFSRLSSQASQSADDFSSVAAGGFAD